MLLIPGDVGEFIYSLPIVVACTLISSYFVAMLVTPIMCYFVLKPKPVAEAKTEKEPRYDRILHWCLNHKPIVLGGAVLTFVASLQLLPVIGSQFFPPGDRDQFFIDVWLPEGASIDATEIFTHVRGRLFSAKPADRNLARVFLARSSMSWARPPRCERAAPVGLTPATS